MSPKELFLQAEMMGKYRIVFALRGFFTDQILVHMADSLKSGIHPVAVEKKLFGVVVELAQNINHYSTERHVDPSGFSRGTGLVVVVENPESFQVTSGNRTGLEQARQIACRIAELNDLDPTDLRTLHSSIRKGERPADSQGAGLGLIELRRKSGHRIDCQVEALTTDTAYVTITVTIGKSEC